MRKSCRLLVPAWSYIKLVTNPDPGILKSNSGRAFSRLANQCDGKPRAERLDELVLTYCPEPATDWVSLRPDPTTLFRCRFRSRLAL